MSGCNDVAGRVPFGFEALSKVGFAAVGRGGGAKDV